MMKLFILKLGRELTLEKPYQTTLKDVGSNFSALTSLRSKCFRAV